MKTYDELLALITSRGVHPVFGGAGDSDWGIEQNSDELAQFLVHMQELGVESVLEIGTGYKAGLARFLHDDLGWKVTSVDIKDYGHQFGGIQFLTARCYGNSLDFFPFLPGVDKFDLVIIDADHSYESVKADDGCYRIFADKVIAFHDIAGLRDCEGVTEYWEEIAEVGMKLKPGYYEIMAEGDERGGIGYIVLSEVQDEAPVEETVEPKAEAEKPPAKPKTTAKKPVAKKPATTAKK